MENTKIKEINNNLVAIYNKLDNISKIFNNKIVKSTKYDKTNSNIAAGITRNENNIASKKWISSLRNPFIN